jgi:hypothetical protein
MFSALLYVGGRLPRSLAGTGTRLMLFTTDRYFAYAATDPAATKTTTTTAAQPITLRSRHRRDRPVTIASCSSCTRAAGTGR